jgi:hypothetical protein
MNQLDNQKFFSISTINKNAMKQYGIEIPLSEFKEIVKRSLPYTRILTGSVQTKAHRQWTNIYRYEDFALIKSQEGG